MVLGEERDAARTSEENLFAHLAERTQDLERLQESYVDMTDRCNDKQDEISELREQLQQFKDSLAGHFTSVPKPAARVSSAEPPRSEPKLTHNTSIPPISNSEMKIVVGEKAESKPSAKAQPISIEAIHAKTPLVPPTGKVPTPPTPNSPAPAVAVSRYDDDFDDYEEEFEDA